LEIDLVIKWVEAHPNSIDILKWVALLILAWVAGLFGWVKKLTKKPSSSIISEASMCLVEKLDEHQGQTDAVRSGFLLDVTVRNPTSELVVVESFSLSYRTSKYLFSWSQEYHNVSLPSRPRQVMGSGIKWSKVFFTNYDDDANDLTMTGRIDSKEFQNAYLFFASFTFGTWRPKIKNGRVLVKLTCTLTTGEKLVAKGKVRVTEDKKRMEKWVPGFLDQVQHERTWSAVVEQ